MNETIRLIGKSIRLGSVYLPTRNLAAMWATRARHKDYFGQAKAVFNGFLSKWRYVKDPVIRELVIASPEASFRLVMAGDGIGLGEGLGGGDCDCATIALGSLFESIGFPTRISTVAHKMAPRGKLMSHVYPEVLIPNKGWVPADPVVFPKGGFGAQEAFSRKVIYNLDGNILKYSGNLGLIENKEITMYPKIWERPPWRTYGYSGFFGSINDNSTLKNWETVGLSGFGYLIPELGIIQKKIPIEVMPEQTIFYGGLARTPMVELSRNDFNYMKINNGMPYNGMLGLSDDGTVYYYDNFSGFFRRLFKKISKVAKKVGENIRKDLMKITKSTPGGKTLVSVGKKKEPIDMKLVLPTTVQAKKISTRKPKKTKVVPIASFVPGDGPSISLILKLSVNGKKYINIKRKSLPTDVTREYDISKKTDIPYQPSTSKNMTDLLKMMQAKHAAQMEAMAKLMKSRTHGITRRTNIGYAR